MSLLTLKIYDRFDNYSFQLSTTELAVIKHKLEEREEDSVVTFADYMDVMAEHMATTTRWGFLKTPLQSHIGIETLPEQLKRRIMRKGFEFNVMVVGESGVGKSTLINTIFKGQVSVHRYMSYQLKYSRTRIRRTPSETKISTVETGFFLHRVILTNRFILIKYLLMCKNIPFCVNSHRFILTTLNC